MLDYDLVDAWSPQLAGVLTEAVPTTVREAVAACQPEYVEDALENLLVRVERGQLIESTLRWIEAAAVRAYHGTRLASEEADAIRDIGLQPLVATERRVRLERALSRHPDWSRYQHRLDAAISAHSGLGKSGRREGQVHLTLSRSGLTKGFDHYLRHGAEFDQHVAHELFGPEGEELLAQDGTPMLVSVLVPGAQALEATHRYFTVDQMIARGDLPNLVSHFLEAWAFKLAVPTYQTTTRQLDCGLQFRETVPAHWIVAIEVVSTPTNPG